MNKHMNLFYSYGTHHLEDNVTRALLITLKSLRPIHLRLFLKDVILSKAPNRDVLLPKLNVLGNPLLDFDVQLPPSADDDKLTEANGVLAGITASGKQKLSLDETLLASGGSRPDAILTDEANELSVLFETKLGDNQYREQLERHFRQFFDASSTTLKRVHVEIGWRDISSFLDKVRRQMPGAHAADSREAFLAEQFIEYLDLIGLGEFLGFNLVDFIDYRPEKLHRFLFFLSQRLESYFRPAAASGDTGDTSARTVYDHNQKLYLKTSRFENLWFGMDSTGIRCVLVCGAIGKWRARSLRDFIETRAAVFRDLLSQLHADLAPHRLSIELPVHCWLRKEGNPRFGAAWLGNVRGTHRFPEDFDKFRETMTEDTANSFEYLEKPKLNERFAAEIAAQKPELDDQGLFPKGAPTDRFLQYCYFDIVVGVPEALLIRASADETAKLCERVISGLSQVAMGLDKA